MIRDRIIAPHRLGGGNRLERRSKRACLGHRMRGAAVLRLEPCIHEREHRTDDPAPHGGNRSGRVFVSVSQCSLAISPSIWSMRSTIALGGGASGE